MGIREHSYIVQSSEGVLFAGSCSLMSVGRKKQCWSPASSSCKFVRSTRRLGDALGPGYGTVVECLDLEGRVDHRIGSRKLILTRGDRVVTSLALR